MIAFDDRSALTSRTTGWERYAREIEKRLPRANIARVGLRVDRLGQRFWSDLVTLPKTVKMHELVHFPTFPPSARAIQRARQIVYTIHDLTWWRFPETSSRLGLHYYRPMAERAIRHCIVVTPSEAVRSEVIDWFGVDGAQVHAIPLGVTGLPRPGVDSRTRPYILSVGTIEPRKNINRLVRAFSRSGLGRTLDLVLVGRFGWGSRPEGVDVLSGVDDGMLASLYSHALGVIQPSLYEGFGLPLVEAAAAGVPVACSDIPVFREVMGHEATYFDPLSEEDMVCALRQIATAQVPAASAVVAERFTWDITAKRLLGVYGLSTQGFWRS